MKMYFKRIGLCVMCIVSAVFLFCNALVVGAATDIGFSNAGDCNSDMSIDVKDLVRLKKYEIGNFDSINVIAADVNSDGTVNALDTACLKRHLIGVNDAELTIDGEWTAAAY